MNATRYKSLSRLCDATRRKRRADESLRKGRERPWACVEERGRSPHPDPLPEGEGTPINPVPKGEGTMGADRLPKGEGTFWAAYVTEVAVARMCKLSWRAATLPWVQLWVASSGGGWAET
jgi:hypothetical protein